MGHDDDRVSGLTLLYANLHNLLSSAAEGGDDEAAKAKKAAANKKKRDAQKKKKASKRYCAQTRSDQRARDSACVKPRCFTYVARVCGYIDVCEWVCVYVCGCVG